MVMERPLLLPLGSLIAGISITVATGCNASPWYFIPASLLLLFGVVRRSNLCAMSGFVLLSYLWGGYAILPSVRPVLPADHISNFVSEHRLTINGVVDSRPEKTESGARFSIRAESVVTGSATAAASGRLLVTVGSGAPALLTGDRVSFSGKLRQPRNFGIAGERDVRFALALRNIFATAFVASADDLRVVGREARFPLQRKVDELARRLGSFIDRSVPSAQAGILKAILIGDRGSVSRDVEALYARTGINHILSVSGFHLGIIALSLYLLLSQIAKVSETLLLLNLRKFLLLATIPILLFYLLISGTAPATVRSLLMISACLGALLVEREYDPLNILALAALSILLVSPGALYDLSFQLSFLALWGILLLVPLLTGHFPVSTGKFWLRLLQFAAVSAAATVATLLPVAYHFHRVSLMGVVSNFIAVPLLGYGAVLLGFTGLVLSTVLPVAGKYALMAAGALVEISNQAMSFLDTFPLLPPYSPGLAEVYLGTALLIALTVIKESKYRIGAFILIAILFLLHDLPMGGSENHLLRVTFLSVGQGECTLVRFPDGSTMLVDGGGALHDRGIDVGERLVAPALWSMGVRRIDRMVLTHPHPDHLRGLLYLVRNFRVGEFWESGYSSRGTDYVELLSRLAERGVPVHRLHDGMAPLAIGDSRIDILWPPRPSASAMEINDESDLNSESLVFRLSSGEFSILFTGDSGFVSEERLLGVPQRLASTVLKVAHHGSRHSTSLPFIDAVRPRIAIISAGFGNSFRLPARETLNDLESRGIRVFRTDRDGSVEISASPSSGVVTVQKYPENQLTAVEYVR